MHGDQNCNNARIRWMFFFRAQPVEYPASREKHGIAFSGQVYNIVYVHDVKIYTYVP